MNRIQRRSQIIENNRLKLLLGLSLDADIDTLTLRAMWSQLDRGCGAERHIVLAAIRSATTH